jgi:hypothetical protein
MNQQQMISEIMELECSLPDGSYPAGHTIWDQSAKIFADVLNQALSAPVRQGNKKDTHVFVNHKKQIKIDILKKKSKTHLTKLELIRLQEEHMPWLR